jgi:glyoxylase-like metal-dependent hydrolase (beta-lactamase superfamily II)
MGSTLKTRLELNVVGAGDWKVQKDRHPSCFVLSIGDTKVLLDCGFGALGQMASYDIDPLNIDEVWITHFHADHLADLLPLLIDRFLKEKQRDTPLKPLTLRGPAGFAERVTTLYSLFCAEAVRDPRLVIYEARQVFSLGSAECTTVPVNHIPGHQSVGFEVRCAGHVFLYAGDASGPLESQPDEFQRAMCYADTVLLSAGAPPKTVGGAHIDVETAISWALGTNIQRLLISHVPTPHMNDAYRYAEAQGKQGKLEQISILEDGDDLRMSD